MARIPDASSAINTLKVRIYFYSSYVFSCQKPYARAVALLSVQIWRRARIRLAPDAQRTGERELGKREEIQLYHPCDLCQRPTRCGQGRYDGMVVQQWKMWVCNTCRLTDDVPRAYEERAFRMLDEKGIAFTHNKLGLIIIPR